MPEEVTRAVGELARSHHTTVSTVLQAAFAQLLCSLTGQHDVAFGTVVLGSPFEVAGAHWIVGLLINTVPVRANITPATTTAKLIGQLQSAHSHTLPSTSTWRSATFTASPVTTGLFDTVFVYENYPQTPPRCWVAPTSWSSPI